MKRLSGVMHTGHPDDHTPVDALALANRYLTKIGVRAHHTPAVVHRYSRVRNNPASIPHDPRTDRSHVRTKRRRDVHTPVPRPQAHRSEPSNDLRVLRHAETETRRRQRESHKHESGEHALHRHLAPPTTRSTVSRRYSCV